MSKVAPMDDAMAAVWAATDATAASELMEKYYKQPLKVKNFVSGKFTSHSSDNWIDSFNPRTGKVYSHIPNSPKEDLEVAIDAATEAFKTWSKTTREERSRYLIKVADLIQENFELFAIWESIDQGKSMHMSRIETSRAVAHFRYFATYILHTEGSVREVDGVVMSYEHRSPAGVFGLITPWNVPFYLLSWKVAPCLAFGCTAVVKPSEVTSMSAFMLCECFRQAGIPDGVINMVFGDGPTTGGPLVKSPKLQGLSFTGGPQTGIRIRQDTAHEIGKHVALELGGKNPVLVFDDCNFPKAIGTAAAAAFSNQGEICLCGSRIYVQRTIYSKFVEAFKQHIKENYQLGGMVGAVASLGHYHKVRGYLVQAEQEGATFETGGIPTESPEGYWIEPTILTGVSTKSTIMRDEIFGPVVTIAPFDTEEEAIFLANDNPNGLASVLLTENLGRMRRVGESIDSGLVWVNCWLVMELGAGFGGMKMSGLGREGGGFSRDLFTNLRTIHIPHN